MPKTNKTAVRASRALKRIQREPVGASVRDALHTEVWIRSTAHPADGPLAMQDILDEVLDWFCTRAEKKPIPYERIDPAAPPLRFWLDVDLIARCRALARRDGVTKRQVIGTALILYGREMVPPSMKRLRQHVVRESDALYQERRRASNRSVARRR